MSDKGWFSCGKYEICIKTWLSRFVVLMLIGQLQHFHQNIKFLFFLIYFLFQFINFLFKFLWFLFFNFLSLFRLFLINFPGDKNSEEYSKATLFNKRGHQKSFRLGAKKNETLIIPTAASKHYAINHRLNCDIHKRLSIDLFSLAQSTLPAYSMLSHQFYSSLASKAIFLWCRKSVIMCLNY